MKTRQSDRKWRWGLALLLALGLWLLMQPVTARAETVRAEAITVTNTLNDGAGSLRAAIAAAAPGDTVVFSDTLAGQTITLSSQLEVNKLLTIDGAALAEPIKISGNNSTRVFSITADATLSHLDIISGTATHGGGVYVQGRVVTITHCALTGNTAQTTSGGGGGLYVTGNGYVTVNDSVLAENTTGYAGGGAYNESGSTLLVSRSTFSGNSALYGGALGNRGILRLNNSTLSGNANTSASWGGSALDLWGANDTEINHCTIVSNTAQTSSDQSGILLEAGTLILRNSIVAHNNDTHNFYRTGGTFTSQGYNLANAWNGGVTTTGDQTADPRLDALADNGGSTFTHALMQGSPALDAANPVLSLTTDQRGLPRPQGAAADIGAFERGLLHLAKTVTPTTDVPYHGLVTYTLTISNAGASDAPGVWLRDALPDAVDFARWVENHGVGVANDEITWNGTLTATTALTFTFVATQTGGYDETVVNTAALGDAHQRLTAAASFTVERPQLALRKTVTPAVAAPYHGLVTYTLVLSNAGSVTDHAVSLTDTLPAEMDFVQWVGNAHGASVVNDAITWSGVLTAHTALTFTFQVTHTGAAGDVIVNTAAWRGMMQMGQATASLRVIAAGTLFVQNANDSGPGSLRQAIADAHPGDTIVFSDTLAGDYIALESTLDIIQDLTLDGSGLSPQVNIGADAQRLFFIADTAAVTMTRLVLRDATGVAHPLCGGGGGAICNLGALTLQSMYFTNNNSDLGGAVYSGDGSRLWVYESEFVGNYGSSGGGALCISGAGAVAQVLDSRFQGNRASYGGGILLKQATLTVQNSHFSGNQGGTPEDNGGGGGINQSHGTLTVTHSTFSGNRGRHYGGGIRSYGGILTVTHSTFSNNTAQFQHGGAIEADSSRLRLSHSTLSGNTSSYGSSALYLQDASNDTEINHCTIVSNTANLTSDQSGILLEAGALRLRNSIVAHNNGTNNFRQTGGTFTSQGYNLSNAWNGLTIQPTDLTADPWLGPLADNGGETWTHALFANSPAIDAADPTTCPDTDQRGFPGTDLRCDIGAYELQYSDSDTVIKSGMTPGVPYTFGPTRVRVSVTGGDAGTITATKHLTAPGGVYNTGELTATWQLTASGESFTATVAFCYTMEEIAGLSETHLRAFRWNEGAWEERGGAVANGCVTIENITAFSAWTLFDTSKGATPTAARVVGVAARDVIPLLAGLLIFGGAATFVFRRRP